MKTLTFLFLRGLPGSGKSTFATELVKNGSKCDGQVSRWKRLNKDTMREMVDGGSFSPAGESLINDALYYMAREYLLNGYNVVSDNMNLDDFHYYHALKIVGELRKLPIKDPNLNFEVMVKDFNTPLATCIERDAKRPKPVTADVIQKIAKRWMQNGQFPVVPTGVYEFNG